MSSWMMVALLLLYSNWYCYLSFAFIVCLQGWLGAAKLKGAMNFERLVPALKRFDAPRDVRI